MKEKQRINIAGWIVFAIAFIVYFLTMAPTASFWDCGEFIACSNELEVTHPPGAPFYLLLGRIFSMLSFGQVENVAYMVNFMSVLSGAFTALFVCWTTVLLARRGLKKVSLYDEQGKWMTLVAGMVAGLSCTFADSIWWNNVEAEVYGMSSFFTAIVVWLIFKWQEKADEADHLKWIVLIAYLMGLSIGVHLLNLLTIPALALVIFYRKFPFSWKGLIATLGISIGILFFIQYGIIQYTFSIGWAFEKFFTGTVDRAGNNPIGMGLPMGTGFGIFAFLIISIITGLLIYSQKIKHIALNMAMLCLTMIIIGFSSYAIIYIRSNADPGIDMNNPEDLISFLSYMRREQYGDRPLLKGPLYNGQIEAVESDGMKFMKVDGEQRYVEDIERNKYVYRSEDIVWFPRMYDPGHYRAGPFGYINYVKNKGADENNPADDKPSRADDFSFFIDYQLRHMYLRYFMWNFAGRASDLQDDSWESGFEPSAITSLNHDNKAKNHYYFLPLFLGLIGLVWQFSTSKRDTAIIGLLFLFTGFAIIIYLNQWPQQPRERDYSFAGSFQTFCIWIGLGSLFLFDLIKRWLPKYAHLLAAGIAMVIPLWMAIENWDDHSRKGRYIDREFAYNLLNSCDENAILFTGGDNDTFPLWYIQEVEGVRTDVRIVNLELLISDWYIDQMKAPRNGAPPVPISMDKSDYQGDAGMIIRSYPSKKIVIPVDKQRLLSEGLLSEEEASWAQDEMVWDFRARGRASNPYILRKDSVMINIIKNVAADDWKRPVYFAGMMSPSSFIGLEDFFRLEGLAYRVVPVKRSSLTPNDIYYGYVGQDIMENNLLNEMKFSRLDDPSIYLDDHARNVIARASYRNAFYRLATSYANQIERIESDNNIYELISDTGTRSLDTLNAVFTFNTRILTEMQDRLPESELERFLAQNRLIAELKEQILENQNFDQINWSVKMDDNDRLIARKQGRIADLLTFMEQKLPDEAIPFENPDWGMLVQIYAGAGMDGQLLEVLGRLEKDAIGEIEFASNSGRRMNPNDREVSACLMVIQYYMRFDKEPEARALSGLLQKYTGDTRGNELIERELNRNATLP